MKKIHIGFRNSLLLIVLFIVVFTSYYMYRANSKSADESKIQYKNVSVNNYDLDGIATIDFPCKPERNEIFVNKEHSNIQHTCYLNEEEYPSLNMYTVNIYTYESQEKFNEKRKCPFQDNGVQTVSDLQLHICHMPVHDINSSETLIATLEMPSNNRLIEFFISESTYDGAYQKLTNFTKSFKLK